MRTATDDVEEKLISDVKNHGVHIVYVLEDEEYPSFAYTIGLYENYLHPEIIIVGLKQQISNVLLNNMAYDVKHGKNYTVGTFHDGVLDNYLCYFGEVPKSEYKEHVGGAIWFYESTDFPLVQCVYPTVGGKFPWEKDFPDDARFYIRLLIAAPKEH